MADSAADLARRISEIQRQVESLGRASQISRSTISIDGTDMPIPDAIGQGVKARVDVEAIRGALEQARAELDAAMSALTENLAEAEELLAGAEERLSDAETKITDAFGRIDTVEGVAGDARSAAGAAIVSASAAQAAANAAQMTADGKNRVYVSVTEPVPARVNLATNGSFEAARPEVAEVRRNFFPDPLTWGAGWEAIRASKSVSAGVLTLTATAVGSYPRVVSQVISVAPGEVWSIEARMEQAGGAHVMAVQFMTSADVTINPALYGEVSATGVIGQRLSTTVTAPAAAAKMYVWLGMPANVAIGTSAKFSQPIAEKASIAGPFFAPGLASPDSDLAAAWTGTANASPSILTGARVASPTTGASPDNAFDIQSTQWAKSGTHSLRVSPNSSSTASRLRLSGYNLSVFQAGKTYTVLATLRLASPQVGTLSPSARTMDFATSSGQGHVRTTQSPNEAGTYEHRMTFTVPETGVTWATVLLYNGAASGGGDVWWDDLLVVEGEYDGPYFMTFVEGDQWWVLDDGAVTGSRTWDGTGWGEARPVADADARAAAEAAQSTADGLPKVLHGATAPSGAAPNGSIWFQHDGSLSGNVIGQWNRVAGAWVSTPIRSEAIANLDVGKLTAGSAAIADLVAQKIAAASGQFLELDVGQLVASDAAIAQAVIEKLFADMVVARMAFAEQFIGGNAIFDESVTAAKMLMDEGFADKFWANEANFGRISTESLEVGKYGVNLAPPLVSGSIWGGSNLTLTYLNNSESGQHVRVAAGSAVTIPGAFRGTLPLPVVLADDGSAFRIEADIRFLSGRVPADSRVHVTVTVAYDNGEVGDAGGWLHTPSAPTDWEHFVSSTVHVPSSVGRMIESATVTIRPEATANWTIEIRNLSLRRSNTYTYIDRTNVASGVMNAAYFYGRNMRMSGVARADQFAANSLWSEDFLTVLGDANIGGTIRTAGRIGMTDGVGVIPTYTFIDLAEWKRLKQIAALPKTASGSVACATGGGGQAPVFWSGLTDVTFPPGLFTSPPKVTVQTVGPPGNVPFGGVVEQITTTGCKVRGLRIGAQPDATYSVHWIASGQ